MAVQGTALHDSGHGSTLSRLDIKIGPALDWTTGVPPERPARRSRPFIDHPAILALLTFVATIVVCHVDQVVCNASTEALLLSLAYHVVAIAVYRSLPSLFPRLHRVFTTPLDGNKAGFLLLGLIVGTAVVVTLCVALAS